MTQGSGGYMTGSGGYIFEAIIEPLQIFLINGLTLVKSGVRQLR